MKLKPQGKPYIYLFGGSLFILMSMTNSSGFIPSNVKLYTGIIFLAFGCYLYYNEKKIKK